MRNTLKNSIVFLILGVAIAVAGCESNSENNAETVEEENIQTPHAVNEAATLETGADTVIIKMMKFNPQEIRVKKGHTVVWINHGIVAHNVMQQPDTVFVSDTLAVGDVWEMKVEEGFDYICSIHPTMNGKVIVEP